MGAMKWPRPHPQTPFSESHLGGGRAPTLQPRSLGVPAPPRVIPPSAPRAATRPLSDHPPLSQRPYFPPEPFWQN